MNADTANNRSAIPSLIIKPWLRAGLVAALVANVFLSAILIVKLGGFDESKRQAEEAGALVAKLRGELTKLHLEVEALTKQKEALAPTVAEWQQRLKENSAAEAILATLDAKQRQTESDIAQVGKRLEDANTQKAELAMSIERLKSERDALAKSTTDAKVSGLLSKTPVREADAIRLHEKCGKPSRVYVSSGFFSGTTQCFSTRAAQVCARFGLD